MAEKQAGELVKNRRSYHDYEILDTYEAGIVLTGTEIKSLRQHGGSLQESYVRIFDREAWLIGASIAPYKFGNIFNHEERRDRKLLLHKSEIAKLHKASQEKGLTIVALSMYLSKGRVKVKIAVGRGKKSYDKREVIKEREANRDIQRMMKRS